MIVITFLKFRILVSKGSAETMQMHRHVKAFFAELSLMYTHVKGGGGGYHYILFNIHDSD